MAERAKGQRGSPPAEPRPVVRVAYAGVMAEFRLYTDKDGSPFVRLPNGKKAPVEARRDGTYLVKR